MYCIKCGTKNDDDSKFCTVCGAELHIDKKAEQKTIRQRLSGIRSKNEKILKIAVVILGLIILSSIIIYVYSINNQNKNDDIDNIEDLIVNDEIEKILDEQDQNIIQDTDSQDTYSLVDVVIFSTPSGANVYINNVFRGKTPTTVSLSEGNYYLKTNLTGYKSIKTDFNVTSDMDRLEIDVTLESID